MAEGLSPVIVFLFDTETTGLLDSHLIPLAKQPHIIEFYGCLADLSTGEIIGEIDHLIKPPVPISEEITRITGLTDEALKDSPPFAAVAGRIRAAIEDAPRVVAHNLSYDREMIDIEFERLEQKVKWPRLLCTVEATLHLKGFRLNLTGLHEHLFGEGFPSAHRARNDVQALLRCACELHRRDEL